MLKYWNGIHEYENITIFGHSLGSACAVLLAYQLCQEYKQRNEIIKSNIDLVVFGCPKVGHAGVSPSNHARFDGCLAGLRAAGAAAGGATRAAQMGADRCSAERQNAKTSVRALARLPAGERESHGVEVGRGWLVSRRTRSQRNRCALYLQVRERVTGLR